MRSSLSLSDHLLMIDVKDFRAFHIWGSPTLMPLKGPFAP